MSDYGSPSGRDEDAFVDGYITAALWSSADTPPGQTEPVELDGWDGEIDPATLDAMREDCASFLAANWPDLAEAMRRRSVPIDYMGHDLWLTRNHHGAGFWDRGLGDLGDKLSDAAQAMGEVDLYIGDDGSIYA